MSLVKKVRALWWDKVSGKMPYCGLVIVAFLVIQAHRAADISEKTLSDSITRQETLRNLLWTNLLMQRALVLKLTAKQRNDLNLEQDSIEMLKSIPSLVNESDSALNEIVSMVENHAKIDDLSRKIETYGVNLNAEESNAWFDLREKNQSLLEEMRSRQTYSNITYGIFVCYLLFLGYLTSRTRKAELSRDLAERANKAKSAFLANMSHELRTPMHGILSFARFGMRDSDNPQKQGELKSYFSEIHDSGSRLMQLLNDLLDLAKLEARKMQYNLDVADLAPVVQTVVAEMHAYAAEKKIDVVFMADPQVTSAEIDNARIAQVVRNILSNAIHYSYPNTEVKISVALNGKWVQCSLENSGKGIPQEELATIFDKFVQSSKTRTGAGGTGLGLAICREIIEAHNGKIWAESEINKKTTFHFKLPFRPVSEKCAA